MDLLIVMPDGTPRRKTAQELYKRIEHGTVPFDVVVTTPSSLARHRDNPGLIYGTILEEGIEVYAAPRT